MTIEGRDDSRYTDILLQYASTYTDELNWKLVVLHGFYAGRCTCRNWKDCGSGTSVSAGKHPILKEWDATASNDSAVIVPRIEKNPHANLGVLLGPESGVIDIEFDCDEGRQTAEKLFDGIFTPTYESARSRHYLFQWSARLPGVQKITPKSGPLAGLEIRIGNGAKATQSVLPPSRHHSGATYRWLDGMDPGSVEPVPLPREVLGAIINYDPESDKLGSGKGLEAIKQDTVSEGGRNDTLFRYACWLAGVVRNIASYDDQSMILRTVECVNVARCSPPLPPNEVKTIVESAIFTERSGQAKRGEQEQQTDGGQIEAKPASYEAMGIDYDDVLKRYTPGNWRLEVVLADPVYYNLVIPAFTRWTTNKDGKIKVPTAMIDRAGDIARLIREGTQGQAVVNPYPGQWETIWKGRKAGKKDAGCEGLFSQLIYSATTVDGSYYDKRWIVVADYLLDRLTGAYPAATSSTGTDQIVDKDTPTRFSNGDVYFRWQTIFIDGLNGKQFTEEDVKKLRERLKIDAPERNKSVKIKEGSASRMVVMSDEDISHLQSMIYHDSKQDEAPF